MVNSLAVKFVSALLVLALWTATLTMVFNQTVLNSTYVEGQLDSAQSYDRLSAALIDEIAKTPDLAAHPEVAAKLEPILKSDVLKTKIDSALEQMEEYYLRGGPQPVIDLSDLAAQAQAAGIPIDKNSSLNQKIVLGGSQQEAQTQAKTQNASSTFNLVRKISLISSVVLVVALIALSIATRRYTALPTVLITVGVLIALLAVVLSFAPGAIDKFVKFDATSNAFTSLGHDLAGSVARDMGKRFGLIAAIYLAAGITSRILVTRLRPKPVAKTKPVKA